MSALAVLVGQYDSPFVRRVAVALNCYGIAFERRVFSTFADFEAMLALGPLGKVPVFVLPDGECLWDSRAILDFLHGRASPERLLLPRTEPERHRIMRAEATAVGLAEKAYERGIELRRASGTQDPRWIQRLERQIASALAWLEAQRPTPYLCGEVLSIADVTAAIAITYIQNKWPELMAGTGFSAVVAHAAALEATPAFRAAPYSAVEAAGGAQPSR